jgi:hypothetical protein
VEWGAWCLLVEWETCFEYWWGVECEAEWATEWVAWFLVEWVCEWAGKDERVVVTGWLVVPGTQERAGRAWRPKEDRWRCCEGVVA